MQTCNYKPIKKEKKIYILRSILFFFLVFLPKKIIIHQKSHTFSMKLSKITCMRQAPQTPWSVRLKVQMLLLHEVSEFKAHLEEHRYPAQESPTILKILLSFGCFEKEVRQAGCLWGSLSNLSHPQHLLHTAANKNLDRTCTKNQAYLHSGQGPSFCRLT